MTLDEMTLALRSMNTNKVPGLLGSARSLPMPGP